MKKIIISSLLSLLCLFFTFCGNKNSKSASEVDNVDEIVSSVEITEVIEKTNLCMDYLEEEDLDRALDLLFEITSGGKVVKLDDQQKSEFVKRFKMFPVLSYKLESFSFDGDFDNSVTYSTVFFEKDENDKIPNTIAVVFNPVKIDGEWYLTLKNKH